MQIKYFLLSLLLLLVPACRKKPRYATAPLVATEAPAPERAQYDEELGAFVVKDDENKFSAAVAQEELLTAQTSEPTLGDMYKDSAQYGFKTIFFEYDKFTIESLRPDQQAVLEHDLKIAESLSDKGYELVLQGHADSIFRSTEHNMMVSEERPKAVKQYFRKHGVQGEIKTVGFGAEHPIVPEGTIEQQAPNRRVEIYAYGPQEKA